MLRQCWPNCSLSLSLSLSLSSFLFLFFVANCCLEKFVPSAMYDLFSYISVIKIEVRYRSCYSYCKGMSKNNRLLPATTMICCQCMTTISAWSLLIRAGWVRLEINHESQDRAERIMYKKSICFCLSTILLASLLIV